MILEHFAEGAFGASANMARDLLLLEAWPDPEAPRLRHYGWTRDCFTFGYSQKFEWIRAQAIRGADLCRRPTGGGLVDHRSDWTYAFVLPPSHPLHHAPALAVYRLVHEALAGAPSALDRPATLEPERDAVPVLSGLPTKVRGLCFSGAEVGDVIDPESRVKIAGAAMKRNHAGLLMQGSIEKHVAGELDWDAFGTLFAGNLAKAFGAEGSAEVPPPAYPAEVLDAALEKLSSEAWNRRR
jgi:lipoyl(octanoyl) transferase